MYNNKLKAIVLPVVIALAIVLGMGINSLLDHKEVPVNMGQRMIGSKLDYILNMINYSYVDSVDIHKIEEDAIPQILNDLDPHTVYIPAKDMQRVNEEMVGNFGGVGVQFYKYLDTVTVVKVVPGGPSEAAGLQDGDRIVKVNDSIVAGRNMNTDKIMSLMRGEIGTDVQLTIVRRGEKQPLIKNITRGSIPIKSVDVAYMFDDTTGFIKVKTFGMNTYDEFMASLAKLEGLGMKRLIVDLRENEGGILPIAIRMINEFLPEGKLILYTQGKASPRMDYNSNGKGKYQQLPLTVLIDEASASASEIFAGAIQDNDRGNIVGRRSFGKGLVQRPIDLPDGSMIRLTIARYYTPSGRCIQRPYENGKDSKYEMDWITRYEHGEFFSKDSIKLDENLRYSTGLGRPVYGGGGIMPDVFVPQDTTGVSSYLIEVSNKGLILQFSFQYTDRNRAKLSEYDNEEDLLKYLRHQSIVEQFVRFADSKGVKRRNLLIHKSYKLLERSLYGNIIYNILGREQYIRYINQSDTTVKKALDILERGEAFPKAPEATPIIEDTKDDGKEKRTAQAGSFVEDPTQLFHYASVC